MSRILSKDESVAAVAVAVDEVVARDTYTLNDTAADILKSAALLKVKSSVIEGEIKVTLAGKTKTVITLDYSDVNEANIHVVKVWNTGTDLTTSQFYLWQ